jgi:hypothetical protein
MSQQSTDHELRELVPGEPKAIRSTLRWLNRLDRNREDVGHSLFAAERGEHQNAAAQAILRERAREQCLQLAELLFEPTYESVVAPHVAARLRPLLLTAVDAAHRLADAVQDGPFVDEATQVYLDGLGVPAFELRLLEELLVAALAERTVAEKKKMTVEEANKEGMARTKEIGPSFWDLSARAQAKEVGCTWKTWTKTTLFKKHCERSKAAAGQAPDTAAAPVAVSFTDKMEEVTGEGRRDEVLNGLADAEKAKAERDRAIAEHNEDYEPSPLDPDPPDGPPTKVYRPKKRI